MTKTLSFPYGDSVIQFEPVYSSRRRTVEIAVEAPGKVVVVAPEGFSEEELIVLVSQKSKWITQQLFHFRTVRFEPVVRELVSGESLLYLGRNYKLDLKVEDGMEKPEILLDHGVFRIRTQSSSPDYLRPYLIDWYGWKAFEKIDSRIKYFAPKLGITPIGFRIKEQKKRWGSCTKDGMLFFNWRCVLAPAPILDYIVAHELCHILEHQHSARFWKLLRAVMPEFDARKQWLKENGVKLDI